MMKKRMLPAKAVRQAYTGWPASEDEVLETLSRRGPDLARANLNVRRRSPTWVSRLFEQTEAD